VTQLYSPKQVARAIQASESSVKRWCDKGDLPTQYTAGGHRKIPVAGLIEFLRNSGLPLIHPELIGLPPLSGLKHDDLGQAGSLLIEALLGGQELRTRQIITELYLAEHSLTNIFDRVIAPAMVRIGEEWQCGELEIYQERRSCELILQAIQELRMLLPLPQPGSPVAIGGTLSGDYYRLPTSMVEMILREHGWNAASLGDNLPVRTLERAIEQYRPRIFWLSVSHVENESQFIQDYDYLYDTYGGAVIFVLGGRALHPSVRQQLRFASCCDTMQHLEAFLLTLSPPLAT